ncbi:MAG: CPBP family intramembrane glutamic endopeptidase [Acidimicrobiia bacterium]
MSRQSQLESPPGENSRLQGILGGTVGLLAIYNFLSNRVFPTASYVPANLAMSGILLGLGRAGGLSWGEMGLARKRLSDGLKWGLGTAAVVAVGVTALALVPAFRSFFEDQRVTDASSAEAAYEVLVRIPLGTAVFEEVAFRGVLLGLLLSLTTTGRAVAISSSLFGLWHILPTLDALETSPVIETTEAALGVAGALAAAVAATTVAGFGFSWLRLRSGSLLAPMLAHASVNSLGFLAAYVLIRSS